MALSATSCGKTPAEPSNAQSVVNVLGFDSYADYRDHLAKLELPIGKRIVACAAERGIDVPLESVATPGAGLPREAYARTLGYGVTTVTSIALSPEARQALDGPTGCEAKVREGVMGAYDREMAPFAEALSSADERAMTRPDVVAAFRRWSTCMRQHGQVFDSPLRVAASFARRYHPDQATPSPAELRALQSEERSVAQDDLDCQRRHVDDVLERARAITEAEVVARESDRLERARKELQRATRLLIDASDGA